MKQSEVELSPERLQDAGSFLPGIRKPVLSLILFAVIPAIFLFVALQLTKVSGQQWLGSNFENSYTYLFNSLLIVKGEPPFHVDHLGTTTQVFGAAVLEASGHPRLFQGQEPEADRPAGAVRTGAVDSRIDYAF